MSKLNLSKRGSILPDYTEDEGTSAASEIPVDAILESPHQPRGSMAEDALTRLAESIEEQGVLQPVLVRQKGRKYELLAGHRRLEASKRAGMVTIPAIVRNVDDQEAQLIALTENLNREDITPIEEAHALRALQKATGWGVREMGRKIGRHPNQVSDSLKVAEAISPSLLRKAGVKDFNALPFSSLKALLTVEKAGDRQKAIRALADAAGKVDRALVVAKAAGGSTSSWKYSEKKNGSGWTLSAREPDGLPEAEKAALKERLELILKEMAG
jgi:ParB/RepB/Spo0J family partition protein